MKKFPTRSRVCVAADDIRISWVDGNIIERKAAKEHVCHQCQLPIEKGMTYQLFSYAGSNHGMFHTRKLHTSCFKALNAGEAILAPLTKRVYPEDNI